MNGGDSGCKKKRMREKADGWRGREGKERRGEMGEAWRERDIGGQAKGVRLCATGSLALVGMTGGGCLVDGEVVAPQAMKKGNTVVAAAKTCGFKKMVGDLTSGGGSSIQRE